MILLLSVSIFLTQIPLFNYLGYEFSAATALLMSIVSGVLTVGLFNDSFKLSTTIPVRDWIDFQKRNILLNVLLLTVPLVVITANLFLVKNCSYVEGLAFYVLIPFITTVFSSTLAGLCCVMFRPPRTAYFIILTFILLHPLWLAYFTPQIYSYNFIYGFFPGFSYDEVLTITPTLVLFRVLTLLAALFFFFLSRFIVEQTLPLCGTRLMAKLASLTKVFSPGSGMTGVVLVLMVALLFCSWIFRVEFGFESSPSKIRERLDKVFRTEHFSIHYEQGSFSDEEIRGAAAEHEFRLHQIEEKLHVVVSGSIDSYLYPSSEMKSRYIGTATTNIAKPWRREIHLNKESWQHVLKHELVHVAAGEFGMPVVRANYRVGLVEGLAMAVDWDFSNRTLHEYAAAMEHFGVMKDVTKLMSLFGFPQHTSTVSYVLCGSFCRFLMDRYGVVRFKALYGGKNFPSVYGKDTQELVEEWKDFLSRISVSEEWKPHVQFYFDRKPIFAKECARYIARLNEEAFDELNHENPVRAMQLFEASLGEQWNTEAFTGLTRAAFAAERYDSVIQLVSRRFQQAADVGNLILLYGDALWATGDIPSAHGAYENALSLDLSESHNEAAALRLAVLRDRKLQFQLLPVLVGFSTRGGQVGTKPDSGVADLLKRMPNSPVIRFLHAQILYRMKKYEEARRILDDEVVRPAPPKAGFDSPILSAAREKLLGLCAFRLRMFQQARVHFWQAMNFIPTSSAQRETASILRLHDWIDRCEWFAVHGSRYLEK